MSYLCFGVGVIVPMPVPFLVSEDSHADFRVAFGPVKPEGASIWEADSADDGFRAYSTGDVVFLEWEDARYRITAGDAVVEAADMVRGLEDLFGPAWTVVLAFRGVETLHGSAVATPLGSVAILGDPGAGKSTLTWRLTRAGFPLVADDLLAIPEGSITPLAGPPRLRLRLDLAESEGIDGELDPYGKLRVATEAATAPPPLRAMICLSEAAPGVRVLKGAEAVDLLRRNLFSPVLSAEGQALRRFALISDLAARVRILEAPARTLSVDDVMTILEDQ